MKLERKSKKSKWGREGLEMEYNEEKKSRRKWERQKWRWGEKEDGMEVGYKKEGRKEGKEQIKKGQKERWR